MKTIQPLNEQSQIWYNLPTPTYTSTENNALKDKLNKDASFPDIKRSIFDYSSQFIKHIKEQRRGYQKNASGVEGRPKLINRIKQARMPEEYQNSPYLQNHYQLKSNVGEKLRK
mmetsp:Transcript_29924/g.34276  ORF Transcript_29924/g.34276 Transcript_29924/m.34276 type:complete len:114 (-) Transcript_29924:1060-1401(-)